MKIISKIFIFFVFLGYGSLVLSAPPVPGKKGFIMRDGVNSITHLQAMRVRGLIRPAGTPATYKVLVIRVEFQPDTISTTTDTGEFDPLTTKSVVEDFMNKMRGYYTENSYGLITVSATVTNGGSGTNGSYQLKNQMSYYGSNDDVNNYAELLNDAVQMAKDEIDFTKYHHYMIFHAGAGEETDIAGNSPNDIWSVFVDGISGVTVDEKTITNATFVPETGNQDEYKWDPLGVICHEYGHQLGLPDLYRTDGDFESGVGKWSLMDYGIYSGSPRGSNPSHLDAWSKLQLGLINPQVFDADNLDVLLQPAETAASGSGQQSDAFIKIPILSADDPENEYLLIEYRATTAGSYDNYLPTSGILIWHVDDSVGSFADNDVNNNPLHRRLDLIEQDKTDSSIDYGSAGDVFVDGNCFSDQSYISARAYNGKASGITMVSISGAGSAQMSFRLTKLLAASVFSIKKINNYPNPARDGATTFSMRFTKPPGSIELDIFTINGEMVRSVSFNTLSDSSANYDWKYEYPWDGRNDNGNKVAPGLYLYRVSIDNETKTGKFAVIR